MKAQAFIAVFSTAIIGLAWNSFADEAPEDVCNDRAWEECAHIAQRECGLSASASEAEIQECEPFRRCEDAAFDECMDELTK